MRGFNFKERIVNLKNRIRADFEDYVNKCLTSGFLPYTFLPFQLLGRALARIWAFIQLGIWKIVGGQILEPQANTVLIFCPNHTSMFDAIILYAIMRGWPRYMCAVEEMRIGDPKKEKSREKTDPSWKTILISIISMLKTVSMGLLGCFAVDRTKGNTALDPAKRVLESGQNVVLFPAGKIDPQGRNGPFKTGAARAALDVYYKLNPDAVPDPEVPQRDPNDKRHLLGIVSDDDPNLVDDADDDNYVPKVKVGLVPVHICYHKRDNATASTENFFAMGFKWRGGVTITFLPTVYIHEMPRGKRNRYDITSTVRGAISGQECDTTPPDDLDPADFAGDGNQPSSADDSQKAA